MAETVVPAKKWWKSKTVWFNVFSAGVLIAQQLASQNIISPETAAYVNIVGNTFLRTISKDTLI